MRPPLLDALEVERWLANRRDWRLVEGHLVGEWRFATHRDAAQLVLDQVSVADGLDHHAVVTLNYRDLRLEVWTHDRGGITSLDLSYAGAIDELVAGRSLD